ncbi:hypothetical protein TanjilG_26877 [Lupinus angustifolius]|uniref:Uncharacterized protein n=1 Tax=Lupinus angustifolius TaxID=3871 RepID=A0A4P1RIP7_LUPAN|nr:PREDICTED: uncharacterized protein LOC109348176 [Lupinus angustifolius]XP_019443990.1 PREDICTED: uncharacterized protein LOC109348176 [Lupinus angustifolius]OIW11511.1 hypothetical protein TanjilG_26877 [Lupinus angustifolius]
MAKNRNKKNKNGVVSMDTAEPLVSETPQAMDTSESGTQNRVASATNLKVKQKGRPMKRTKNVRKMKAIEKAISANEKSVEKISKNENKKTRVQSAKTLYE